MVKTLAGQNKTAVTNVRNSTLASNVAADMVYWADNGRYVIVWQQVGDIYSRGVLPDGTVVAAVTAVTNATQYETAPA
ncbi:MAG: hypothetical protein KJ069_21270 [Anaerolineae bacterium]|nr:hypothetical protein [Anaerolineae bacterium]